MVRFARMLLAFCVCLSTACAPLLAGKVVCQTASGHLAIEPSHALTGCPATSDSEPHGEEPEPCQDQTLGQADVVFRDTQASAFKLDHSKVVCWLAVIDSVLADSSTALTQRPALATHAPPLPADLQRLSTVILLI